MRSSGAFTALMSPRISASAELVCPFAFARSCAYPIASNGPHLVGRRVEAMRLGEQLAMRLRCTLRRLRNSATRTQAIDFGRVESQFLENLVVVLSDFRSALRGYFGNSMHLNRTADRRRQLAAGAFQRDDDVVQPQLG